MGWGVLSIRVPGLVDLYKSAQLVAVELHNNIMVATQIKILGIN